MSRKIGSESLIRSGSQNPFSPVIPVPDDWRVHDMSLGGSPNFDLQLRLKDKNGVIDPTPITLPLSNLVSYVENNSTTALNSAIAIMQKSNHYYRASNTNYTSAVPAGGAGNYVQHSDIFTITPILPNSEIIVISSTEARITNLDGDDDLRAYLQLRYKDSAGVWQNNEAVDNHNSAPLGVVNVDDNTTMAGTRTFSGMFPAMSRLGAAQKNASGDWEIAIFGTPATDPNSEIELHTAGTGFTIIEVEGGVS